MKRFFSAAALATFSFVFLVSCNQLPSVSSPSGASAESGAPTAAPGVSSSAVPTETRDRFQEYTGSISSPVSSSSTTLAESRAPSAAPDVSSPTVSREIQDKFQEYTNKIASLKSREITKVTISIPDYRGHSTYYSSEDKELISQWVALLQKMRLTPKPFIGVSGIGFGLRMTADGEEISLGGFMGKHIYTWSNEAMMIIENYDELKEEWESLKDRMQAEENTHRKIPFTLSASVRLRGHRDTDVFEGKLIQTKSDLDRLELGDSFPTAPYTDAYFSQKALLMLYVTLESGSMELRIDDITAYGDAMTVRYTSICPIPATGDMAYWRVLVEVDGGDIQNIRHIMGERSRVTLPSETGE